MAQHDFIKHLELTIDWTIYGSVYERSGSTNRVIGYSSTKVPIQ